MIAEKNAGMPVDEIRQVRLECLRLVHRHDRDEQTLIDRAARLEAYVLSGTGKPAVKTVKARQGVGGAPG